MEKKSKKKNPNSDFLEKKKCYNSAFFLLRLKTLSIWVIQSSFFKILFNVCSSNFFGNHQNCCFPLLLFSVWFAHLITIGLLLFAFFYWHKFCAESKRLSGNLSQKRENNEPIPFPFQHCCGIFSKKWNWRSLPFFHFIAFRWFFAASLTIIQCFYFMNLKQPEKSGNWFYSKSIFAGFFALENAL